GEAFIVFSLLLLLFEFTKSAKHGKSFIEHFLSLLLAAAAAAEFVMVTQGATSTFLLFVAICVVDLFAGFAAALRRARRKVVVEQAPVVAPAPGAPGVMPPEPPRVEPAPPPRAEPSPFAPASEPVVKAD